MTSLHIYRAELTWGLYSRVATKLGIGRAHVSRVAKGERRSPKVESAIKSELRRINRLVAKREAEMAAPVELERAA
jgi:hypothetical protein